MSRLDATENLLKKQLNFTRQMKTQFIVAGDFQKAALARDREEELNDALATLTEDRRITTFIACMLQTDDGQEFKNLLRAEIRTFLALNHD